MIAGPVEQREGQVKQGVRLSLTRKSHALVPHRPSMKRLSQHPHWSRIRNQRPVTECAAFHMGVDRIGHAWRSPRE